MPCFLSVLPSLPHLPHLEHKLQMGRELCLIRLLLEPQGLDA